MAARAESTPTIRPTIPRSTAISVTGRFAPRSLPTVLPSPWDDDNPGFGASGSELETRVIAGNTFDFVSVHGAALLKAGYDFASVSRKALLEGRVELRNYDDSDSLTISGIPFSSLSVFLMYRRYLAFPL